MSQRVEAAPPTVPVPPAAPAPDRKTGSWFVVVATYSQRPAAEKKAASLARKLRPGVDPVAAMMLVSRFFLTYFSVEIVFGVPHHFGKDTDAVIREIADMLRHGMLSEAAASTETVAAPRKKARLA